MTRRLVTWSGWLVALALAVGLVGVPAAQSQAPFAAGAFVRAADGSFWVVSRGVKIGIAAVPDSAGAIPGLTPGPIVGTAGELAAALAALGAGQAPPGAAVQPAGQGQSQGQGQTQSPPPPPPPAAAQPPNPAQSLIGQSVDACYGTAHFQVTVDRAVWAKQVGGRSAAGNAMWAVAVTSVTNLGTQVDVPATVVKVVDDLGRNFSANTDVQFTSNVASEQGVKIPYDLYSPSITEQTVFVFQVAPDAQRLTLTSENFSCQ